MQTNHSFKSYLFIFFTMVSSLLMADPTDADPFSKTDIFKIVGATSDMSQDQIKTSVEATLKKYDPRGTLPPGVSKTQAIRASERIHLVSGFLENGFGSSMARMHAQGAFGPQDVDSFISTVTKIASEPPEAPEYQRPNRPVWVENADTRKYAEWVDILDKGWTKYQSERSGDWWGMSAFLNDFHNELRGELPEFRQALGDWQLRQVKNFNKPMTPEDVRIVSQNLPKKRSAELYKLALNRIEGMNDTESVAARLLAATWGNNTGNSYPATSNALADIMVVLRAKFNDARTGQQLMADLYNAANNEKGQNAPMKDLTLAAIDYARKNPSADLLRAITSNYYYAESYRDQIREAFHEIAQNKPELARVVNEVIFPVKNPNVSRTAAEWREEFKKAQKLSGDALKKALGQLSQDARASDYDALKNKNYTQNGAGGNQAFQEGLAAFLENDYPFIAKLNADDLKSFIGLTLDQNVFRKAVHRGLNVTNSKLDYLKLSAYLLGEEAWKGGPENYGLLIYSKGLKTPSYLKAIEQGKQVINENAKRLYGDKVTFQDVISILVTGIQKKGIGREYSSDTELNALMNMVELSPSAEDITALKRIHEKLEMKGEKNHIAASLKYHVNEAIKVIEPKVGCKLSLGQIAAEAAE